WTSSTVPRGLVISLSATSGGQSTSMMYMARLLPSIVSHHRSFLHQPRRDKRRQRAQRLQTIQVQVVRRHVHAELLLNSGEQFHAREGVESQARAEEGRAGGQGHGRGGRLVQHTGQ